VLFAAHTSMAVLVVVDFALDQGLAVCRLRNGALRFVDCNVLALVLVCDLCAHRRGWFC